MCQQHVFKHLNRKDRAAPLVIVFLYWKYHNIISNERDLLIIFRSIPLHGFNVLTVNIECP